MSSITDCAVETAQAVAKSVNPYVPQIAKNAATLAVDTASSAVTMATNTVNSAYSLASGTASSAYSYASGTIKVVVDGATTTITTYTPGPILNVVTSSIDNAKAIGHDPVGVLKPYVPTRVVHAGEKTYEIVHTAGEVTYDVAKSTSDRATQNVSAATGFIVTKVNGTVQYVTSVPAVGALIERIDKLTAPVLASFGVKKGENGQVVAEGVVASDPTEECAEKKQ
ncbi:hypothetical protein BASA50_005395 [Batrachochytrium salamandrivorans]|uniref:Senescence domain-containing protein n=1 Tax=Batrachochytrium salamandrivorans TaxID=1357716 RepID=A0ABQ8FFQ5_9FUNG|nr:hypothetical protein BASA62_007348 [Batrachochytrium salamandrivorans]KAH6571165.1 hypothetical protein BASA60_007286 [Batrachochytrium salamandrivorans]KAH6596098.1 hypothetical protein BASA50_005395 [Batrachochytrium salamandrivorans]KAH6601776.1 hypothetical protein BASA61_001803 [Batrachochytrium salamandrivorans]KAH9248763.1 hypothetical protein BASA81_013557 [Batrachochytrium salamandrivorans]